MLSALDGVEAWITEARTPSSLGATKSACTLGKRFTGTWSARPGFDLTQLAGDPKIDGLEACRGSSLVERRPEKAGVASSILAPGTTDTATPYEVPRS
jgi:hypothetical protein